MPLKIFKKFLMLKLRNLDDPIWEETSLFGNSHDTLLAPFPIFYSGTLLAMEILNFLNKRLRMEIHRRKFIFGYDEIQQTSDCLRTVNLISSQ